MRKLVFVLLVALSVVGVAAQTERRVAAISGVNTRVTSGNDTTVQTVELDSKLLRRKVWFTVILPQHYFDRNESGRTYPVVYLLHGLDGHFDNWAGKTQLAEDFGPRNWIAVTPEGANGWYTDSASTPEDKFESYIIQEVIPEVDHRYRTIRERHGRAIAGLSMGGYGSIKFGLKYPDMFSIVGSFSGALNAALPSAKEIAPNWKLLIDSLASVYGPDDSNTRKQNDIFRLLVEVPPEKLKSLPFVYLDCGTEDGLLKTNRDFDVLLVDRKLPHEFRELPGKHEWAYWNRQVQEFLRVAARTGFGMSQ